MHSPEPKKQSKFRKALEDARAKRKTETDSDVYFYVPKPRSRFSIILSQIIAITIFTAISLMIAYSLFTSLISE